MTNLLLKYSHPYYGWNTARWVFLLAMIVWGWLAWDLFDQHHMLQINESTKIIVRDERLRQLWNMLEPVCPEDVEAAKQFAIEREKKKRRHNNKVKFRADQSHQIQQVHQNELFGSKPQADPPLSPQR